MNNHIDKLRSTNATLIVLSLALIAQIPHAASVFIEIADIQKVNVFYRFLYGLNGVGFAIALELAVLLFVVGGRKVESCGFAIVSVLMNLAYYYLHNVELFSVQALPAWLVSVALPSAIALYSHALAGTEQKTAAQPSGVIMQDESDTVQDDAQKRKRAAQLKSEGLSNSAIGSELNVHRNTISAWLKEVVHTNGYHKEAQ